MIECIPRRCRTNDKKHQLRDCSKQDRGILSEGWSPTATGIGSFCNYFWKDHDEYVTPKSKNEMRCSSCKDKKTPADCLVSPHFISMKYNLRLEEVEYSDWTFLMKHERAQLSCLADCFLMDGNWCNTRLPYPDSIFPDEDYNGEPYANFAQDMVP